MNTYPKYLRTLPGLFGLTIVDLVTLAVIFLIISFFDLAPLIMLVVIISMTMLTVVFKRVMPRKWVELFVTRESCLKYGHGFKRMNDGLFN